MDVLSAPKFQRFLADCHDHRPLSDDDWVDGLPMEALRQRFPKAREALHELIGVQYATRRQRLDVALIIPQHRPQEHVLVAASESVSNHRLGRWHALRFAPSSISGCVRVVRRAHLEADRPSVLARFPVHKGFCQAKQMRESHTLYTHHNDFELKQTTDQQILGII